MRPMVLVPLLLACWTAPGSAEDLRRVRSADQVLSGLIKDGYNRSATFRALVDRLERGDWIVFVQPGRCPERVMVGCLVHFVGTFEGSRYLRLIVKHDGRHRDQVLATVGHELQHAIEVVSDGSSTDTPSLRAFLQRVATERFRTTKALIYETAEARQAGEAVLRELLQR